jgi:hypothetical protein
MVATRTNDGWDMEGDETLRFPEMFSSKQGLLQKEVGSEDSRNSGKKWRQKRP